ncbi:dihydrodipicolinate synthetase family protein [Penicillium sp. DV-2018c]|nr:dihydrodipicolinate synthetase family protein [Penicillium sp. DV-2018c]KAJ5581797.1 dihydrodipicolinate synthetase family protein [Penicillium sp. DV-2018c]
MLSRWNLRNRREGEREHETEQVLFKESRSSALDGINDTYNKTVHHGYPIIEPKSYDNLGITCRDLPVDNTDGELPKPTFFDPRPISQLPPINMESNSTRRSWKDLRLTRALQLSHPFYKKLSYQSRTLVFEIDVTFRSLKRDQGSQKDSSLAAITNWQQVKHGGNISPNVIAEEFDPVIWQSLWCHPVQAFQQPQDSDLPHTMVLLNMAEERDDRLFQAEVLSALVIMLTVLESDRFLHHNTVPVMVVSVMARLQVQVLHCHYSREGLVVRKSRFISFTESESASMDIVMSLMASKAVGDTKDSANFLKCVKRRARLGEASEIAHVSKVPGEHPVVVLTSLSQPHDRKVQPQPQTHLTLRMPNKIHLARSSRILTNCTWDRLVIQIKALDHAFYLGVALSCLRILGVC